MRGGDQESLPCWQTPAGGAGWRSVLSNRGDSYKAHGLSVQGGVMRGVWSWRGLGSPVNKLGDQFKKTETEVYPENGDSVSCG